MIVRPLRSTTRDPFGTATLAAPPTAEMRPPSTTSTAFCCGARPVPSIRVAPLSTTTSARAGWETRIASARESVLLIRVLQSGKRNLIEPDEGLGNRALVLGVDSAAMDATTEES